MNPLDAVLALGTWSQHHSVQVLEGLGGTLAGVGLLSLVRRIRRGDATTHGSARWATPRASSAAAVERGPATITRS